MADFFNDPQFPYRPQHPDFHRLMDVVNDAVGESNEGGCGVDQIASEVIDAGSLAYMALQRAKMASRVTGVPVHVLASVWMDAFYAGVKFEQSTRKRPA